jgi:branched-chain amino acid transport system ATP-binding protein
MSSIELHEQGLTPPGAERDAPTRDALARLAAGPPHLDICDLRAGYGTMEVLHGIDLIVGRAQSLCIVGPNGSGKSTVLNALFGLADVQGGSVEVAGRNVTLAPSHTMLMAAKVAYVLQAGSVFHDMTVEENLLLGGHLLRPRGRSALAVERIFESFPRLAEHRTRYAGALSGGERRLLELSRALITDPEILLVDEPSIGLEPRTIDMVFEMLDRLQRSEGKTIVIIEQNAKKGLEFADLGYVLVSGRVAAADTAATLIRDSRVGRLFLGG